MLKVKKQLMKIGVASDQMTVNLMSTAKSNHIHAQRAGEGVLNVCRYYAGILMSDCSFQSNR